MTTRRHFIQASAGSAKPGLNNGVELKHIPYRCPA